eukprot:11213387-Lingulodinium_polyedra.AAC.1
MRFASRCGSRCTVRPRCRATFCKRCAIMRSSRPSAAATAHKSHTRARNAHNNFCCTHGVHERFANRCGERAT